MKQFSNFAAFSSNRLQVIRKGKFFHTLDGEGDQ